MFDSFVLRVGTDGQTRRLTTGPPATFDLSQLGLVCRLSRSQVESGGGGGGGGSRSTCI